MLRILTEQNGDRWTISLHGRLAGDWVELLERTWQSLATGGRASHVTAVLSDVSFIDSDGERLLERMWSEGVEFIASGCLNRYVVDRIQARSTRRVSPETSTPPGHPRRRRR